MYPEVICSFLSHRWLSWYLIGLDIHGGGAYSLELIQSLIESILAVREQRKLCLRSSWCWQDIHAPARVFLLKQKMCQCHAEMGEQLWDLVCGSDRLYSGGLVSVETGVLRLTREWRVFVRRGERSSAWQSGRLKEVITAVDKPLSAWSAWERKKLFFQECKPFPKAPHKLVPAMPESFLTVRS